MDYRDILELILDERDTTVGGGSSAALAGAMACGLIGMVALLSKGKTYGYTDEKYDSISMEVKNYRQELLQACVDDNKAYLMIKNAYKLPKETEVEKEKRKASIQEAGYEAAKVPLFTAICNKKILEIGLDLMENSNPSCETDLKAGVRLAEMGLQSGKDNVLVNIPLIKDENKIEHLMMEISNL